MQKGIVSACLVVFTTLVTGCNDKEQAQVLTQSELATELLSCAGAHRTILEAEWTDTEDFKKSAAQLSATYFLQGAALTDVAFARQVEGASESVFRHQHQRLMDNDAGEEAIALVKDKISSCFELSKQWTERVSSFEGVRMPTLEEVMPTAAVVPKQFTAVLSCGMNGRNINILACFKDTELKVTQGNQSQLYKIYNLNSAGEATENGLQLVLPEQFEIVAQNSHRSLVLGIEITDEVGEVVHRDQVGQWGVINVSN